MDLKLLPDELFLDLFDYLNGINLFCAFFGLNSRLNFLLYKQFRFYSFQFDCVSKPHFDLICEEHLPFIANRVITLRLSDDYGTPKQMNLFFSHIPSFRPFTHLRSLMLSSLHSYEILLKLLDQCQHLGNLTDLKFCLCYLSNPSADYQFIINKIGSLPKLTTCDLGISIKDKPDFFIPTIISTSPEDNYQTYYDEINRISNERFSDTLILSDIRLPHIYSLRVEIPIDDQF